MKTINILTDIVDVGDDTLAKYKQFILTNDPRVYFETRLSYMSLEGVLEKGVFVLTEDLIFVFGGVRFTIKAGFISNGVTWIPESTLLDLHIMPLETQRKLLLAGFVHDWLTYIVQGESWPVCVEIFKKILLQEKEHLLATAFSTVLSTVKSDCHSFSSVMGVSDSLATICVARMFSNVEYVEST